MTPLPTICKPAHKPTLLFKNYSPHRVVTPVSGFIELASKYNWGEPERAPHQRDCIEHVCVYLAGRPAGPTTYRNNFLASRLHLASPNDIHNSEKLRNPFLSGSAILNAAPLYVSCKNAHPQSKFRPIALQRTSN